ncbi:MAG: PilN domain-containing protein [Elusimicrobia bacterium]|nr:PilN domain-containing protein [Elusimicrobiota bacterium]
MIKINLVPKEILAKAQQRQKALQFGLAGAAAAFLIVLASLLFVVRLHRLQGELAIDKAELQRLDAVVAKVKEMEAQAKALRDRLGVIDGLDRGRRTYPYFMSDFVRSIPSGVRVKTLDVSGGGGGQLKLNITAEARTNEDIRTWIHKMEDSGRFTSIELGAMTTQESAAGALRSFTLTAAHTPQL